MSLAEISEMVQIGCDSFLLRLLAPEACLNDSKALVARASCVDISTLCSWTPAIRPVHHAAKWRPHDVHEELAAKTVNTTQVENAGRMSGRVKQLGTMHRHPQDTKAPLC